MTKINKRSLIIISTISLLIIIVIPLLFYSKNDSAIDLVSTIFAGLAAVATIITLFLLILLFQKYGIESRFVEKQIDKVFELVDILKGKVVTIHTKEFKYFLNFNIDDYDKMLNEDYYKYIKSKTMLIDYDDYKTFVGPILNIKFSYWLPKEIKSKMDFFEIKGFHLDEINPNDEEFARVQFAESKNHEWKKTFPSCTVDEYIIKKNELIKTIEEWFKKYSDIEIDLKLDEPNWELQEN